MKRISLAIVLAAIMMACNTSKKTVKIPEAISLTDTYWKLTELNGKPMVTEDAKTLREIYLVLYKEDNRVGGNAGCNGYGGTFKADQNGFNLSFKQMFRTQMACDGLDVENEYMAVLEKADAYYIIGNELQLIKARMSPLAKFVAVPGKAATLK